MNESRADFAVVVVAAAPANLRSTLARLQRQTICGRIEVVVVVPDGTTVMLTESDSRTLHSLRTVPCERNSNLPHALAVGARAAMAPVVALIEDHCFPDPAWAEALLSRHMEGYAVVGPEISNANPGSAASWCSFLMTHGEWAHPATGGEVAAVAGDNSSYLREVLLTAGDELDVLLASGTLLHWKLRAEGHRVYLEPRAKAAHVTPSRVRSYVASRFHNGRTFAGLWARQWPWSRRVYFAALSPVIAARRVNGVRRQLMQREAHLSLIEVVPLLSLAHVASSLGYLTGFLSGAGASANYSSDLYFSRHTHLREEDVGLAEHLGTPGSGRA